MHPVCQETTRGLHTAIGNRLEALEYHYPEAQKQGCIPVLSPNALLARMWMGHGTPVSFRYEIQISNAIYSKTWRPCQPWIIEEVKKKHLHVDASGRSSPGSDLTRRKLHEAMPRSVIFVQPRVLCGP